jgi:dephospho-CoA kinase
MGNTPYLIGITGGIGSGKSIVSHLLRLMGVPVYDCDSEAKRLMCESEIIRGALVCVVGDKVYDESGRLDRAYLSSFMFANAERVALVNHIVHPVVRADFKRWAQRTGRAVVAVESAILFEAGMEADVDAVWVVHAPEAVRLQRAILRDASNEEAVRRRMQCQLSEQGYLERADEVVRNDGRSSLVAQVLRLLHEIYDK